MHPVRPGRDRRLDILMHRHGGPEVVPQRHKRPKQGPPLVSRKVLLAQAEPAAPGAEHRTGDLDERPRRLSPVGDDKQRR
jgi:hypothetical protein